MLAVLAAMFAESRRLRRIRDDCLGISSAGDAFRLLLQIGDANIAGADRAVQPLFVVIGDEEACPLTPLPCSLRSLRLALVSRCLPHSLPDENVSVRSLVPRTAARQPVSPRRRAIRVDCSVAALAVSDARCARGDVRRGAAVFVGSDETTVSKNQLCSRCVSSAPPADRRREYRGARIAPGSRLLRIAC